MHYFWLTLKQLLLAHSADKNIGTSRVKRHAVMLAAHRQYMQCAQLSILVFTKAYPMLT